MTPRSIRRAAERKAEKLARKAEKSHVERPFQAAMPAVEPAFRATENACSEAQLAANRTNCIPGLELAIYAQGRIQFADDFTDHDAALRPSLLELKTFLTYEKQLRNLQLQESRLSRRREKEIAELRELQEARKTEEKGRGEACLVPLPSSDQASPTPEQPNGFESSIAGSEVAQTPSLPRPDGVPSGPGRMRNILQAG